MEKVHNYYLIINFHSVIFTMLLLLQLESVLLVPKALHAVERHLENVYVKGQRLVAAVLKYLIQYVKEKTLLALLLRSQLKLH